MCITAPEDKLILSCRMQSAWSRHKPNLQRMFVEDLQGYDVARVEPCIIEITRRTEEGWEPRKQVHLEGHEAEVREERAMQAYYKMKMQQLLAKLG